MTKVILSNLDTTMTSKQSLQVHPIRGEAIGQQFAGGGLHVGPRQLRQVHFAVQPELRHHLPARPAGPHHSVRLLGHYCYGPAKQNRNVILKHKL